MNSRKRIAVMVAQPNLPYQQSVLQGIMKEAFAYDMDVLVFSSFVKLAEVQYLRGEQSIYNVLNYDLIDAVIVMPDTIQIEGVSEKILERLKASFHGPVLILDMESEEFEWMHNDDFGDVKSIMKHLIEIHKMNRIAFLTGPKEHPHSVWRVEGYKEGLREHGILVDESLIFYGDFWYHKGAEVVEQVLAMEPRPQAIACASEVMAISVYDALVKRGIKIPQEMAVVSYDPYGAEIRSSYRITTMPRSAKQLGTNAARNIIGRLLGIKLQKEMDKEELILKDSCGCCGSETEKALFWTDMYEGDDLKEVSTSFYSSYNFMLEDIIGAQNLTDSLYKVMYYTNFIKGFSTFHICLNQDWIDRDVSSEELTEDMVCVLELSAKQPEKNKVCLDNLFERDRMAPVLEEEREKPSVFYFTPIHFNGVNFGYSIVSYENECRIFPQCYSGWIRKLNNGLESQRRQSRLQSMYDLMRNNAVKDLLTGVYSRNGFNMYGAQLFQEAKVKGQKLLVIVGDINDTKYVNDTYGHMEGDAAIQIVAEAFRAQLDSKKEHGKVFRIGGDEFVLMALGEYPQKEISDKIQGILTTTEHLIQTKKKPYSLSTSLGAYYSIVGQKDEMNKVIAMADAKMYVCKNIHRKNKGYKVY